VSERIRDEEELVQSFKVVLYVLNGLPPSVSKQFIPDTEEFSSLYFERKGGGDSKEVFDFNEEIKIKENVPLDLAFEQLDRLADDWIVASSAIEALQRHNRSQGGLGKKLLTEAIHKEWLVEELANFKGEREIYKRIASALFNKYEYKVSAKTVSARIKELGLLESA